MKKSVVLFALIIILLVTGAVHVSAAGQGDKGTAYTIEDAENLMAEKKYDDAIIVLVEIVRNDPEQMEKAQSLINDIKKVRDKYNAKYEELITVLFDEEDYERSLQLITELETLDSNPNDSTQNAIREARISAELVYFRQVFNEIMDRGRELIVQGDYREAVRIYRTGFNLYRRTFDEMEYGNIIKDPVYRDLDRLNTDLNVFNDTYDELARISAQGVRIISTTDPLALETTMAPVYTVFSRFSGYHDRATATAITFGAQNSRIRNLGTGVQEDFFLSFMEKILTGRSQMTWREGVREAMALYWEAQLLPILTAAETRADNLYADALALYNQGQWDTAERRFRELEKISQEGEKIAGLPGAHVFVSSAGNPTPGSGEIIRQFGPPFEKFRYYRKSARSYTALCAAGRNLDLARNTDRKNYNALLAVNGTMENDLQTLDETSQAWTGLGSGKGKLLPDETFDRLTGNVLAASVDMTARYENTRTEIITNLATMDLAPLETRFTDIRDREERSTLLVMGDASLETAALVRYPRRGMALVDETLPLIATLETDLEAYIGLYRSRKTGLKRSDQIDRYIAQAEKWVTDLRGIKGNLGTLYAQGQDAVYEAGRKISEGDLLLVEARREIQRSNYEEALKKSSSSFDAYVAALGFDEDSLNRNDLQKRTDDFNRNILEEWNRYVIITVRGMITEGSTLYYQGSYFQSENTFKEAEALWAKTNSEPNGELTRWLGLVRNALSANTGRIMLESDPLYGEVTQLLNLAYRYYEEGKKLLTRGNKTDGLRALATAQEYVRQITVLFPLNQEASILGLRIEQVRDEKVFYQRFSELYNAAREKIRTGINEKKREAYNDLRDLAAVLPDYPGLQKTIVDLEYDLGIRQRPVDTTKQRESDQYFRRALAIVRTDDRRQFRLAESYLKTAIELNPDNQQALELLDQVMIYTGGTAVYSLNTRDQAQYRLAEEKYRKGEYYVARDIVNKLLENEQNRRFAPLLELKRSIDSRL
jgi:hypothetical protein